MARKQAGQVVRRRDTREHVAFHINAFNARATGEELTRLRFTSRETMPPVTKLLLRERDDALSSSPPPPVPRRHYPTSL